MANVLIIDDRSDIRLSLIMLLEDNGHIGIDADNPQIAQSILKQNTIDLIVLDMNFTLDTTSGEEGLAFLKWLQSMAVSIPVIAMTAWTNTALIVQAMKAGAADFIEKPWRNKHMLHAIEQQLSIQSLQQENAKYKQLISVTASEPYQWQSPVMQELQQKLVSVANTDVSVLLTGENGTGKTEFARYLHQHSLRHEQPFVSVNMGAISESLFESEMFGHIKGAFTDAKVARMGRFELAQNGSLFLDEITNIPISQQNKMLRVLESGEFEAVGSNKTLIADARIICATNENVQQAITSGKFRQDLYFRLNTIELMVPALRERQRDLLPLTEHFILKFSKHYQRDIKGISTSAQSAIKKYSWPGNVRELSHLIERAVLLSTSTTIDEKDLQLSFTTPTRELPLMTIAEAEVSILKQALAQCDNHVASAAKLVGLTKSSMYRRMEKYGLN